MPTQSQAQLVSDSNASYASLYEQGGFVTIDGEPNAKVLGKPQVTARRP